MTGRTHDLAAFTAVSYVIATQPLEAMSLATLIAGFSAAMIGGLAPDIDQPTADLWRRLPAGSVIGRILSPILGGHRFISHSILGVFLFGIVVQFLLGLLQTIILVDMNVVWWAFMIGFVSHLLTDMVTRDGVPLLFPVPVRFGFPPFRFLRIKTGGLFEKSIVFPGLMAVTFYLYYTYYGTFLEFLRQYVK